LDRLRGNVSTTPCDHAFHTICLQRWLEYNTTCPVCREIIVPDGPMAMQVDDDDQNFNFVPFRCILGRFRCCYYPQQTPGFVMFHLLLTLFLILMTANYALSWSTFTLYDYIFFPISLVITGNFVWIQILLRSNGRCVNCRPQPLYEEDVDIV
jgi:hypothetical protein